MIKLIINKIDGYNYYLSDNNNNIYKLNLEFYDINEKPNIGDYIYINAALLKEKNSMLCFGSILGDYGKTIEDENNIDIMILFINGSKYYLKRYYG